jgi:hypothetical protein
VYNQDEQVGYLKPKRCFVKPFFKNGIQQLDLGNFLSFLENWGLIPPLEPRNLLFIVHLRKDK